MDTQSYIDVICITMVTTRLGQVHGWTDKQICLLVTCYQACNAVIDLAKVQGKEGPFALSPRLELIRQTLHPTVPPPTAPVDTKFFTDAFVKELKSSKLMDAWVWELDSTS
jgi:hypothetical protein